ncbi:hypothetical protein RCL1_003524 [Eukaryota sp. TZLM3-RCL]
MPVTTKRTKNPVFKYVSLAPAAVPSTPSSQSSSQLPFFTNISSLPADNTHHSQTDFDMSQSLTNASQPTTEPATTTVLNYACDLCAQTFRGTSTRVAQHLIWELNRQEIKLCTAVTNTIREEIIKHYEVNGGASMKRRLNEISSEPPAKKVRVLRSEVVPFFGNTQIVQLITDNAANCRKAGKLLSLKYPSITWTPCAAHSFDLFLKKSAKLSNVKHLVDNAVEIVKFIMNHNFVKNVFTGLSSLLLLSPAITRFYTRYLLIHRLIETRNAIIATVMDLRVEQWVAGNSDDSVKEKYQKVKLIVLDTRQELYWQRIGELLSIWSPFVDAIKVVDSDGPNLCNVVKQCQNLLTHLQSTPLTYTRINRQELVNLFEKRKRKMLTPLHYVAHSLNPLNHGEQSTTEERRFVRDFITKNYGDRAYDVLNEIRDYRNRQGPWRKERDAFEEGIHRMNAADWWSEFGDNDLTIRALAMKVLAQPASSSAAERNWSVFSLIWTKNRNRLKCDFVDLLVFNYCNLKISSKKNMGRQRIESRLAPETVEEIVETELTVVVNNELIEVVLEEDHESSEEEDDPFLVQTE